MNVPWGMIIYLHLSQTSFATLSLTNDFDNKQFLQTELISTHMETR